MTWILQSATILTIDLDLATLCEDLTIWQTGDNGKRNLVLARIWQGSILPRPLTYNLGLKSLKILYQKALCVESMIQNGPKGEKVSRQESYKDLLWSTAFTFFQKQWILKNTMWVKYWPDWSKSRKKICSLDKDVQKDLLWPSPHTKISV